MSTRTEDRDFERSQNAADRRDETRANNLPTCCAGCGKWRVQPECRELYIREIEKRDGECKCSAAVVAELLVPHSTGVCGDRFKEAMR